MTQSFHFVLKHRFLAFAFLSVAFCGVGRAEQDEEVPTHILEVQAKSYQERQKLTDMGYALDEIRSDKIFITGHLSDLAKIQAAGFHAQAIEIKPEWRTLESQEHARKYSSYNEIYARLHTLASRYPHLVTLFSYGRTQEHNEMLALRISGLSESDAAAAKLPSIMYMGCHHAREHLSVEVPMLFAEYLVENYERSPELKTLMDSREIFIAPVVNVDGHLYDYSDGITGKMWRKNRRDNGDGTHGVDLNRNYGFGWGTGGSSSDPSSITYKGPSPFSEPETQAVRDFVRSQPRMTTLLTLHTFSELILYPWGGSRLAIGENGRGNPDDLPVFEKMAREMAGWNHYRPMQASDLYVASGDTTDWAYGERGIFAFTFELSPTSVWEGGFYPDPEQSIDPVYQANLKPMLYLLNYADNPHRVLTDKHHPNFDITPAKSGIPTAHFHDLIF